MKLTRLCRPECSYLNNLKCSIKVVKYLETLPFGLEMASQAVRLYLARQLLVVLIILLCPTVLSLSKIRHRYF